MTYHTTTLDRFTVVDALDTAGLTEAELHEDYSGRAMYGATCFGIVCDPGEFALFCAALGAIADDWDFVGGVCTDNMGLSTIWYWPGVKLEEEAAA